MANHLIKDDDSFFIWLLTLGAWTFNDRGYHMCELILRFEYDIRSACRYISLQRRWLHIAGRLRIYYWFLIHECWHFDWDKITPSSIHSITIMVEEGHWWRKRWLQSLLISLKQIHHNSPDNHWNVAKAASFGKHFLFAEHPEASFKNAGYQIKAKLLIDGILLTPHHGGSNYTSDECINIPSLPRQICQQTLNQFVNEYKKTQVSSMHPGEFDSRFQFLICISFTKEKLHDNWVRNSNSTTVIEALSCAAQRRYKAVVVV